MKNKTIIFLALFLAGLSSCKKDGEITVFTGYSYYPANTGHAVIYDVDSIWKDGFTGLVDTARFQVMELIESTFLDNEGRPTLRLERYKRGMPGDPWVIYKVWTANVDIKKVEKKEDNQTFVKLVFPPKVGLDWNGNALNDQEEKIYEIITLNDPDNLNGLAFDSTLTVLQNDEDLFIRRSIEIEKFATGVGMYYKEQFNGEYKTGSITEYDNFLFYSETIVSYSN